MLLVALVLVSTLPGAGEAPKEERDLAHALLLYIQETEPWFALSPELIDVLSSPVFFSKEAFAAEAFPRALAHDEKQRCAVCPLARAPLPGQSGTRHRVLGCAHTVSCACMFVRNVVIARHRPTRGDESFC